MKFTEKQKTIIDYLDYLKLPKDTIAAALTAMKTEEQQEILIHSIEKRYKQKGKVTDTDIGKMLIMITQAKKEVAALDEPEFRPINGTALTTSAISIFNLLDYVNNYFPDILPESVLKHYGYSSRPEGNIGKSALFSRDVDYAEYAQHIVRFLKQI